MCLPGGDPGDIFSNVACAIISTNLKVTSILAQTKREHLVFNYFLFFHDLKDGAHLRRSRVSLCHTKDSISLLKVEKMRLSCRTAKSKIECIKSRMITLSKMHYVFYQETLV